MCEEEREERRSLTFVELRGDVRANSRVNQMLKDFETGTDERNRTKFGGQRRVSTFENQEPQCCASTEWEPHPKRRRGLKKWRTAVCHHGKLVLNTGYGNPSTPTAESNQRFRARGNPDGVNGAANKPGTA